MPFLSASNNSLNHKPERGSIKYTSLKSEIRKCSKSEQAAFKNVNDLGLTTINHGGISSSNNQKESLKKDGKNLSAFGIREEVYKCCIGEWIVTDLDLNIYEEKQAQDVTYLREKRKQKNVFILGLRRCWFI